MKKFKKIMIAVVIVCMVVGISAGSVFAASGTWKHDSKGWWYAYDGGGYAKAKWERIGNKWYYFNGNGYMHTGWLNKGGKRYYLDKSGAMATGWKNIGTKRYYFDKNGVMAKGWHKSGKNWYYLKKDGSMTTGWLTDNGQKYYLNSKGVMVTGKQTINKKTYTFASNGVLKKNAVYSSWRAAYKDYVLNVGAYDYSELGGAMKSARQQKTKQLRYAIHDMDANGTPELFIWNLTSTSGGLGFYVMAYRNGNVKYIGNVNSLAYDTGKKWPGVFSGTGQGTRYEAWYYVTIKNGKVVREDIRHINWNTKRFIFDTNDNALIKACENAKDIKSITYSDIKAMGWNAFLKKYGY